MIAFAFIAVFAISVGLGCRTYKHGRNREMAKILADRLLGKPKQQIPSFQSSGRGRKHGHKRHGKHKK